VFDKLKKQIRMQIKKFLAPRDAEKRFVNPYAMSEPTTPKMIVPPKFKDGKFILEKKKGDQNTFIKSFIKDTEEKSDVEEEPSKKKKKEPGFSKACIDVVISDIELISGEARRKEKIAKTDAEAYDHFKKMIGKKPPEKAFVREPVTEPIITEPMVIKANPVEAEIVEPVEPGQAETILDATIAEISEIEKPVADVKPIAAKNARVTPAMIYEQSMIMMKRGLHGNSWENKR
jgi:hypothetical protein